VVAGFPVEIINCGSPDTTTGLSNKTIIGTTPDLKVPDKIGEITFVTTGAFWPTGIFCSTFGCVGASVAGTVISSVEGVVVSANGTTESVGAATSIDVVVVADEVIVSVGTVIFVDTEVVSVDAVVSVEIAVVSVVGATVSVGATAVVVVSDEDNESNRSAGSLTIFIL